MLANSPLSKKKVIRLYMGIWNQQKQHVSRSSENLWEACRHGETSIAETCIEEGADIDFTDQDFGATSLMMACGFGFIDTARMLVARGANINAVALPGIKRTSWGNRTALHFACGNGSKTSPQLIEMMLEWGANPAMVDNEGMTAIDLAREHDVPKHVTAMLEQSLSVISRDMEYYVPDRQAWKKVRVEIFPVMLEAGSRNGTYRYEMVWYDSGHLISGILSLAEYSVHLEEEPQKKSSMTIKNKKNATRFNIVMRSPRSADPNAPLPKFSIKSEEGSDEEMMALGNCIRALCGSFMPTTPTERATIAETPPNRRSKPAPAKEHRSSAPPSTTSSCQYCTGHTSCHCEAPAVVSFQGSNPMRRKQQDDRSSRSPVASRRSSVLSKIGAVFSSNSEKNSRPVDTSSNVRRSKDSSFLSKIAYFNGVSSPETPLASPAAASPTKRVSKSQWRHLWWDLPTEQRVKHCSDKKYIAERSYIIDPEVQYPTLVEFAPSSATRRRWVRGEEDGWHRTTR